MKLTTTLFVVVLPALFFGSSRAGTAQPPSASPADEEWQSAKSFIGPKTISRHATMDPAVQQEAIDRLITSYVSEMNRLKEFYTKYPAHAAAHEAKRLEAVLLVEAVAAGGNALRSRMESTVRAFRSDKAVPAAERAIVAGTYDFGTAASRIRSLADMHSEYEAIARGLIQEFPDQPQGYVSLLTQAMQRDPTASRAMASEVIYASAAPAEVRRAAQRLVTRLDLVGQPLVGVLDKSILRIGEADGWKSGKPGLIYFWATWSPDSIALGENLKARLPANANVLAVCLDTPDGVLELGTMSPRTNRVREASPKLPGRVVELASGMEDERAVRLGADGVPLLYLVDASGRITDIRGLDGLDGKLNTLGL